MAGGNVHEFTSENWQTEVLNSDIPVVVDFWAVWCGPCRMIAPTIEELAQEYAGRVKVGKVNVDDQQELAVQYRINSIPQIYIFKNGQVKERIVGAQPKSAFKAAIDKVLAS
ncbi:MAG: thioredoxin [Gemmatales bacterium]|nr:thioredoxin [Gemmatales bacterium]MDW8387682.1 thioredoxin [Gemmatales bacterium]